MSSFDIGEAKEDDAVHQCDVDNFTELPTEDGRESDSGCQTASSDTAKVQIVPLGDEIKENFTGCNTATTTTTSEDDEALRLHNVSEPKGSLKKQDSCQSIRSDGRKVSFPTDSQLVTGYLEPVNPWADGELPHQ